MVGTELPKLENRIFDSCPSDTRSMSSGETFASTISSSLCGIISARAIDFAISFPFSYSIRIEKSKMESDPRVISEKVYSSKDLQ